MHLWSLFSILLLAGCSMLEGETPIEIGESLPRSYPPLPNNGRVYQGILENTYTFKQLSISQFPIISPELALGLKTQLKVLKYRKQQYGKSKNSNLYISKAAIEQTVKVLNAALFSPITAYLYLDAYQLQGNDRNGNVFYTGYFTPIIKASKEKTSKYKFPLYTGPETWPGMMPTREAIEAGELKGQGLELAFTSDKLEIYFMQLQGSGIVEYEDGTREYFAFSKTNRHPYRSIGRYMVDHGYTTPDRISLKSLKAYFRRNPENLDTILNINPSYVFFERKKSSPLGAGHVPLTPKYSVAVDPGYIPLGSVLLGEFPIINQKKQVIKHEYQYLLAQDIGGAINGPGHIDFYTGMGKKARNYAAALHHYGRCYLLLPK